MKNLTETRFLTYLSTCLLLGLLGSERVRAQVTNYSLCCGCGLVSEWTVLPGTNTVPGGPVLASLVGIPYGMSVWQVDNPGTDYQMTFPDWGPAFGTRSDGLALDAPYPFGTNIVTWTGNSPDGVISCQQTVIVNYDMDFVTTLAATNVGNLSATLTGEILKNESAAAASFQFQYGIDTSYGSTTASQSLDSGTSGLVEVAADIFGLVPNLTYHYQLVATIGGVTLYGNDESFTTLLSITSPLAALEVTIAPYEAISAGAQWRVDGLAWQNSGVTVSNLLGGIHTVSFRSISGWTTPAAQQLDLSTNTTTTAIGTYIPPGSLQVTINPAGAIAAGAQWRVDGLAWQNSGATVSNLLVGSHSVSFKPISGWTTPAAQTVSITNNSTTTAIGTYIPPGSLQVTISPAGAIAAGAQWQVDGGAWQNSGATVANLLVGSHSVSFEQVNGWTTPTNENVSVSANSTTTATGIYLSLFTYTTNNGSITITGYTGPPFAAVIIPGNIDGLPVTKIGTNAFAGIGTIPSVIIPDSVTNIGDYAFYDDVYKINPLGPPVGGLQSVTIGKSVVSIGNYAFSGDSFLTSVTIPSSVTSIGSNAFSYCSLTAAYFAGNAPTPTNNLSVFVGNGGVKVYYSPGTTGWGATFDGAPTVLWNPQVQTRDASFGVRTNRFGFTITGTTNIPIAVEASTNPSSGGWTTLQSSILTNGSIYFSDPTWTNFPARFYLISFP